MPQASIAAVPQTDLRDEILSIEFAPDGERARRVVSRSNCRPTGKFPSLLRMNRTIHWESPHELNAFRLLESNCAITAYREQPCVIRFRLAGQEHLHYPDCLVTTSTAKALWEIKTIGDARRPEIAARTQFLTQALPAFGYQYTVVLAEDLGRQPRLRNVRLLLKHGRKALSFEQREHARRLFSGVCQVRWTDVVEGRHAPFTLQHACRLVLEGALYINLDLALDATTALLKVPGASLFGGTHG